MSGDFYKLKNGIGGVNWPLPAAESESAVDDLWHAAVNGRGKYFSAKDPQDVVDGLTEALIQIAAKVASAAAAATSNLTPVAGDNFVYFPSYTTVQWTGNLESRGVNVNTGVVSQNATWCAEDIVADPCPTTSGATVVEAASNVLWSCAIDAPIARAPDIVINHTNNTREVLVQDTLHRIHLISATGKVLWSHALDGPILGAVHHVDRFQNGKLQLLCNTASTCYLIDRNGNNVVGFPFQLKSHASAPLAVFDYDGQRDYRVLIPTEDRRVVNLGLDGAPVQGWDPAKLDAAAVDAVHHLRIRNKDHLLVIDGDGGLKVLDRKGNERERVKTKLTRVKEVHAVIPGSELMGTRVHWLDEDLVLHETTLGGEERRTIRAANGRNHFMDLDGDGAFEVVRITDDSLLASNAKGVLFAKQAGPALLPKADAYSLGSSSTGIGVVSSSTGKAWLFDASGLALPGMPVDGSTPFAVGDLNLDGTPELVIATSSRKVVAYRMIAH
jgi:hypothetical protein